jgi:hypothetical protein
MGILSWLFREERETDIFIVGRGLFDVRIAGGNRYQNALDKICGGRTAVGHERRCKALLVEEPLNAYDLDAVMVTIGGRTVGYLSRADAKVYRKALRLAGLSGRSVFVEALVVGGWARGRLDVGNYEVKLDMDMPPIFG